MTNNRRIDYIQHMLSPNEKADMLTKLEGLGNHNNQMLTLMLKQCLPPINGPAMSYDIILSCCCAEFILLSFLLI